MGTLLTHFPICAYDNVRPWTMKPTVSFYNCKYHYHYAVKESTIHIPIMASSIMPILILQEYLQIFRHVHTIHNLPFTRKANYNRNTNWAIALACEIKGHVAIPTSKGIIIYMYTTLRVNLPRSCKMKHKLYSSSIWWQIQC